MHSPYVTTIIWPKQCENALMQIEEAYTALLEQGAEDVGVHWLADDIACDLYHDMAAPVLQIEGADVVTQSTQHRRKKLIISDMDSTLIAQECIDELADKVGIKEKVSLITERAMNGELDFKQALRERVGLLKDLPESALQETYNQAITLMPGADVLMRTMKAHGAYGVVVSGGFTFFTSRVMLALGFDEHYSNELGIENGKLTGEVFDPILDKEAKRTHLLRLCEERGIDVQESLAVGDGANDLPMLLAAGLGVAYHAKPVVQAQAKAAITQCDLSALLYVQGYAKADWVL